MSDLVEAIFDPDFQFIRIAFLMGLFASFAFGCVGSYVVVNRISYVAGALSHAILGGVGFALYAQFEWGWTWFDPMLGALFAAVFSAVLIAVVKQMKTDREDSIIGAIWAIGMAIGLIFFTQLPAYINPMSYLFGNILLLSLNSLYWVVALDAVLLFFVVFGFRRLQAVNYDPEFSRLRGVSPALYDLLLLCMVAVSIVLLVSVVGVILVVALLTIPAAIASRWTRSLKVMMIGASLLCLLFVWSGLAVSFIADWPTGPSIILTAASCYLLVTLIQQFVKADR